MTTMLGHPLTKIWWARDVSTATPLCTALTIHRAPLIRDKEGEKVIMKVFFKTLFFIILVLTAAIPSTASDDLEGNITIGGDLTVTGSIMNPV